GLERVGIHDNFFEIGGDSLALMRMLALADRKLGLTVRVSAFIIDPRIEALVGGDERAGQDKLSILSDDEFEQLLMTSREDNA
ncbi:phosphopantetheine-binding protein, partial [Sinorhizobium sp. CB7]